MATRKLKKLFKAYSNPEFLNSPSARTIRVLSEMIEPAARLRYHHIWNTVAFFGSARTIPQKMARANFKKVKNRLSKARTPSLKMKNEYKNALIDMKTSRYYEDACNLSQKLTEWFKKPAQSKKNFVIASGGGPGIMEAANKGAERGKGKSIGLNISLPMEQHPNPHQTHEISFDFHYFFIRKFWFFYLAKALVVFPGGFGTLDEMFELLTLIQTKKSRKYMPIVLFGKEYWDNIVNFDLMLNWGMISKEDLKLFHVFDDVDEAFNFLSKELKKYYMIPYKKKKR